jgi:hypothetical protein
MLFKHKKSFGKTSFYTIISQLSCPSSRAGPSFCPRISIFVTPRLTVICGRALNTDEFPAGCAGGVVGSEMRMAGFDWVSVETGGVVGL